MASLSLPLAFFSQARSALFQAFEIGEHQFGFDRLDIVERRDLAFDMGDVAVLEAAHDMGDRVAFADIRQKLIAEPFALRGAAHQAGDIDKGQPRRNDLLGARDFGECFKPRVRHRDIADIRLDGAKRIIRRLRRRRLRQRVEKGRFADIGQTDDAAFETHGEIALLRREAFGKFGVEGIGDPHAGNHAAVLQVLRNEQLASRQQSPGDQQGIPPFKARFVLNRPRLCCRFRIEGSDAPWHEMRQIASCRVHGHEPPSLGENLVAFI